MSGLKECRISLASTTTSPSSSTNSSTDDLKSMDSSPIAAAPSDVGGVSSKGKSLAERSKIPYSLYLTAGITLFSQYITGIYAAETLQSWYTSMKTSSETTMGYLRYMRDLVQGAAIGDWEEPTTYLKAGLVIAICILLIYVLLWAPFRAGLWTGARARRHKFHRYMGLAYLVQYFFAWVEFASNYENGGATSFVPHFIAVNGESVSQHLGLCVRLCRIVPCVS